MATYLSRKEAEEMKPQVDKAVEKFLGFSEPSLVTTAINCLSSGYNKKKTTDELAALLDPGMAAKLAERIFELSVKPRETQSKKRHHELPEPAVVTKRARPEPDEIPTLKSAMAADAQLSANQIKSMMANAQKMIEERKRALNALRSKEIPPVRAMSMQAMPELPVKPLKTLPSLLSQPIPSLHRPTDDKAKQIAQLQARIQSKLSTGVLGSMMIGKPASQDKPTPLILDSEGRTVDVTGKEIQLTHVVPTLKANIRAKKHEEFRQKLQERTVEDISESHFFDSRIAAKPNIRNKRALRFHEPGKFQQLADRMRMKAQLEKLQTEISQIAQKTGITSATKLALIAPKVETQTGEIPRVEWWDSVILQRDVYGGEENGNIPLKEEAITNLVEHPTQIRPPTEPLKPVYMPVFLTQKERKKLRRQNRREAWKEEQEKIRLGLEPPPEPKLRISNLMRVLGTEAVQDPTKMEAHVRAQMAKRRKAHEEANAARRLTDEQRREKRVRRLQEDTTLGVKVTVYRVKELTSASKKFKVETNANQLYMTGSVVMYKDCNVVVVEGGANQQNKFKRLMLHRIKWEEDMIKSLATGKDEPNKCVLVWEGMTQQRNFGEMKFKICTTEKLAREQFKKHGVEQYWDLAYSVTVIETSEEK